jgi:hypothetical protein
VVADALVSDKTNKCILIIDRVLLSSLVPQGALQELISKLGVKSGEASLESVTEEAEKR